MGQDLSTLSPEEMKKRQIREMDMEIKHKLGKGANYNMKIVIKGETNTGKTCLFNRLQRKAFIEDHISTEQIQTATIPWDYKVSNDRIKVEVWDVVDHGKKKATTTKKKPDGLKLTLDDDVNDSEDDSGEPSALPSSTDKNVTDGKYSIDGIKLDAETINVYKDANAVLFTMDPRKKWTFEYIERELPNVPKGVFVLILVNYRDCPQNQRVVSEYEVQEFVASAGKYVRALECSMKNCYGMKGVRCFFNLPFLKIKRAYIMQQLKENEADLDAADQEFNFVNSEQHYDFYIKWLAENRQNRKAREHAESVLPIGPPLRVPNTKGHEPSKPAANEQPTTPKKETNGQNAEPPAKTVSPLDSVKKLISSPIGGTPAPKTEPKPTEHQTPTPKKTQKPTTPTAQPPKPKEARTPQPPPEPAPAKQPSPQEPQSGLSSWTSRLFGRRPSVDKLKAPPIDVDKELSKVVVQAAKSPVKQGSIDDFAPITEPTDSDFWAVGVSDDDEPNDKDDDDDEDEPRPFAIAKDEEPDFGTPQEDEHEEDKPPIPQKSQPSPVPVPGKQNASHARHEKAPDENEDEGYDNVSDGDSDSSASTEQNNAQQGGRDRNSFSSSWGNDKPLKLDKKSLSYGALPPGEQAGSAPNRPVTPREAEHREKPSKPQNKYVVLKTEDLPPLPTTQSDPSNGLRDSYDGLSSKSGDSPRKEQESGEEKRHRHRHRDGERRKHRHRDRGDKDKDKDKDSSGERHHRKHRSRTHGNDSQGRPAGTNNEHSGF